MTVESQVPGQQAATSWIALKYFNIYRILLAALFVMLVDIDRLPEPLGIYDARLFSRVSHIYLIVAFIFSIVTSQQRIRYNLQIMIHALVDIIMLSLMMYASNGLGSGFGMLLVIAVAGASILHASRISILVAAVATLAVLGHEVYVQFFRFYGPVNYIHAGILGASFFFTAIIGNLLAARVSETEALARQQAIEINELARLNEHIVQRMQSGIVVLNPRLDVLLINEAAKLLLKQADSDSVRINRFINDHLRQPVNGWLEQAHKHAIPIRMEEGDLDLQASFIKLDSGSGYRILVFLEDFAVIRQKAQQLKLASLGRLAASIAHEVRNPLGAINHAAQLLRESDSITEQDKRLTDIINDHSVRVNAIIENVLDLGRRQPALFEEFELVDWLQQFINEFIQGFSLTAGDIQLDSQSAGLIVGMDSSQLHQVMWNLCENALRYSKTSPFIQITCGEDPETKHICVQVNDFGDGMDPETREHLFEPFFTTESTGTGLGLYLARELCEANQVNLGLLPADKGGTRFKLTFMRISKQG